VPRAYTEGTWSFHLRAAPKGGTRLVVRTRNRSRPRRLNGLFGVRVGEPVHFIMQTRQFHNLRTRVALSPHRSAGRRRPSSRRGLQLTEHLMKVPPSMRYIVRKSDCVRPIVARPDSARPSSGAGRVLDVRILGRCVSFILTATTSQLRQSVRRQGVEVKFAIHPVAGRMPVT
jgi:hypothetical protein